MIRKTEFEQSILPVTLRWESGYANIPDDAGGETYRGITRRDNPNWSGWQLLKKHLPLSTGDIVNDPALKQAVSDLYFSKYFEANEFHKVNSIVLALVLFDFDVHGGYSVELVQELLNTHFNKQLIVDGDLGPKTIAALNSVNERDMSFAVMAAREQHLQRIIERKPKNRKFEKGWMRRIEYFRALVKQNAK